MASSSKQQQQRKKEKRQEEEEEYSAWTKEENKRFEVALARFEEDAPDRWANVARAVGGGKTADQVKRHYDHLAKDINLIDSADKPFYSFPGAAGSRRLHDGDQDQRVRIMKPPQQ